MFELESLASTAYAMLADPWASKGSPAAASHGALEARELCVHAAVSGFTWAPRIKTQILMFA